MNLKPILRLATAPLLVLATSACAGGGDTGNGAGRAATVDNRTTVRFEPNTGTAPDYLVRCIDEARRLYAVAHDAVRLADPVLRPDGSRIIPGVANRGAGGPGRFRCRFDPDLAFRGIEGL